MNSIDPTGSLLYPISLMTLEDARGGFFAHENLLSRLLSDLVSDEPGYLPQHKLLLGIPGIGKTTFLRRLERAVLCNQELGSQWLPLSLHFPHFNVVSTADFWRNCLRLLVENLDSVVDADDIQSLERKIDGLASDDSEAALGLLLHEIRCKNKRLLLGIDNIDTLLRRSEEIYIELFVALQNHPDILVVATCKPESRNVFGDDADFYEIFDVIEFSCIQESDIRTALLHLVQTDSTHCVDGFVKQNPEAAKMLFRLTAGTPRTVMLLLRFIADGVEGDVCYRAKQMLDAIAPFYLTRMEKLSAACQKIVDVIALNWQPLSQSTIAHKLNLPLSAIDIDLKYLEEQYIVRRTTNCDETDYPLFEINERLFNIWYLMYTAQPTRRGAVWLGYFLTEFFSLEALEIRARDHIQMPSLNKQEIEYIVALTRVLNDGPLCAAVEYSVLQELTDDGWNPQALHRIFYWKPNDPILKSKIERLQRFKGVQKTLETALANTAIMAQSFCDALMGSPTLSEEAKVGIADESAGFSAEKWRELDKTLMEELKRWRHLLGHHAVVLYKSIASGEMSSLADTDGAESAAEHWQDPVLAALSWAAWIDLGESLSSSQIGRIEQLFHAGLDSDPNVAVLWNSLGNLLQYYLMRFTEAEQAYRTAISLDPNYTAAWSQIAYLLKHHLKRYAEAETAYRKMIELEPDNPRMYNNLAWFLYQHRKHVDDAIMLSDQAIGMDPDNLYSIHTRATLLVKAGRWVEAEPYLRRFIQEGSQTDDQVVRRASIILFQEIVKSGQGADLMEILDESEGTDSWASIVDAITLVISGETDELSGENSEVAELVDQFIQGVAEVGGD